MLIKVKVFGAVKKKYKNGTKLLQKYIDFAEDMKKRGALMANEQNLKPHNKRPQRERKEIARMGAIASNEVQANKKTLRETANILLAMPVDKETKAELKQYRVSNDNCTYAMALVIAQLKNTLQGDIMAFTAIRDIIGEKPKDNEQEEVVER